MSVGPGDGILGAEREASCLTSHSVGNTERSIRTSIGKPEGRPLPGSGPVHRAQVPGRLGTVIDAEKTNRA